MKKRNTESRDLKSCFARLAMESGCSVYVNSHCFHGKNKKMYLNSGFVKDNIAELKVTYIEEITEKGITRKEKTVNDFRMCVNTKEIIS